ncbi:MAG: c-type cytochrome [Gammaproteobacteria bacterium]|jgi:sulfide dehydrogenase cytochrome subunit|nr:c-type cytochrome [Gammaproteobacteria bacterium]MDH3749120.1 c-type cytochrome [Gammaproteobacteria bacterium]MDH3804965.1 c-type cytochrome [Gammaproteobacteria bacterium]
MKSFYCTAISLALGMFVTASSADELAAITEDCNGCHGDDGVSQWTDVPTIAGMPEYVHADSLYFFRDNERPCNDSEYRQGDTSRPATNMCKAVSDLSDDTIDEIAAYYFELPFVAAQQEFDAALATAGKVVHEEQCDMCHSDGGSNPDDEAGILAGQWMGYLDASLTQYKSGDREQPKKMQEAVDALTDDDIKALVHYYASQQ